VDFNDVKTFLKDSGTALIGSGESEGEDRALKAVEAAINSPLLDQNSIYGAEKLLFFISYSKEDEASINELDIITEELQNKTCTPNEMLIWGHGIDDSLGNKIRITVIATGLHNNAGYIGKPQSQWEIQQNEKVTTQYVPVETVAEDISNKTDTSKIVVNLFPDNDELRKQSEEEITKYLKQTAFDRENQLKKHSTEEISNYRAGKYGLEHTEATILITAVD
jgi:cell division GTPase FtsZ